MMMASNVLKAFRTGVANRSEGDIMEHVLVLEMFQCFSNTQTYLNKKPCLDVKTFCDDMCFDRFCEVDRKMSTGDSASVLCQGVTRQQEP